MRVFLVLQGDVSAPYIYYMNHSAPSVIFQVSAMHCGSCVARIEGALEKAGFTGAANLATGQVRVTGDTAGAAEVLAQAGFPPAMETQSFEITGLSCASCVSRAEAALTAAPGVTDVSVNLASGRARISGHAAALSAADLNAALAATSYRLRAMERAPAGRRADAETQKLRSNVLLALALALPVFIVEMGGHLIPPLHHWLHRIFGALSLGLFQFVLASLILVFPGRVFFQIGVPALWRRAPDMNALVALGTGAAFLYSSVALFAPGLLPEASRALYFESVVVIVALVLLGRWLEAKARGQAGQAVRALIARQPQTALLRTEAGVAERPISEVTLGDMIALRPGDRVPVDGIVAEGSGLVDEAMLTGEPMPVTKGPGDTITGGTINQTGALVIQATAIGEGTVLAEIARAVEDAQAGKLPIQRLVDRVTAYFVPAVLAIAALTVAVWLGFGGGLSGALVAGVSVLVIACPCAMGLATPTSIMVGTGRAASAGVFFRRSDALQALEGAEVFAFDKTGTLTEGRPAVSGLFPAPDVDAETLLATAAAVEARSEHPLARGVVAAAKAAGVAPQEVTDFQAIPGQGASAILGSASVQVGSAEFLLGLGITPHAQDTAGASSLVHVAKDGVALGVIALADTLKDSAAPALDRLRADGIALAIISGDNAGAAGDMAKRLSVSHVIADVKPTEKADAVAELQKQGKTVFVGDGLNDAPALAAADVGIALGSGTDVAIEAADVVLSSSDLGAVARARAISRATMRNIRQNLGWAFGYNVLLIPVAAGVLYPAFGILLSPGLAAGAMAFSSIAVVLNALRLKRVDLDR